MNHRAKQTWTRPSVIIVSAVLLFILFIIAAHLAAPDSYSATRNTVSELASQGYESAWIMRLGLILFGSLTAIALFLRVRETNRFLMPDIALALYGIGILLSGVFSTAPFEAGIPYSADEASLHSLFATIAGVMISLAIISYAFADSGAGKKLFHLVFALLVIGLSALFGLAESGTIDIGKGILQKTMFSAGLFWIAVNYQVLNNPGRRNFPE